MRTIAFVGDSIIIHAVNANDATLKRMADEAHAFLHETDVIRKAERIDRRSAMRDGATLVRETIRADYVDYDPQPLPATVQVVVTDQL